MSTVQDVFGAFFIAFIISYGFTPLARHIAFKIKLLDYPNSKKSHAHPTPLLGGLSMFLAFFTAILITTDINRPLAGILIGATMLMLLGVIDDKLGMMPKMKLSGQILAALIAYKMGVRVVTFEDYYTSMFFTSLWLVGITNAFNLLDNLNGLSSGIAGISSLFFGIIALLHSHIYVAILSFGLAGACFGFLKHNFPKAMIFMGDSGSMFLGFSLASIAILGSWETDKISLSLSLPILVLGYPIFDTTLVTFLRIMEKRPVFIGGRDHSSHILASLGFKKTRAVLLIYIICISLGLAAFLVSNLPIYAALAVSVLTALSMLGFGFYLSFKRLNSAKRRRHRTSYAKPH
ncbi:MAG: undecaprenyl/decaprenyl-phosphate alpha-N-acetylglucosaminyl 1-phosphate transferase [Candidatus Omnitrophica bacterium]|nr:undecaprenyl/decaprenyl-phosphate alpha-N-acetylglucosaminyl 1-phosphate transferase [Candidatus Omnitrophota bacterium]